MVGQIFRIMRIGSRYDKSLERIVAFHPVAQSVDALCYDFVEHDDFVKAFVRWQRGSPPYFFMPKLRFF